MRLLFPRTNPRSRRNVLHNGVHDPGILKAVFLAGGPGSGKSYAVSQLFGIPKSAAALMTSPGGLKLVNSDPFFEHNLRRMGIDPKTLATLPPETFAALTEGKDSPRGRAKTTREAFLRHWTDGRLGLILDGTGDDFGKIQKQSEDLRSLGYDTMMVFVNTSLEVAKKRNRQRARSLPDHLVEEIWNAVQQNLGAFQDYFGRGNIIIVDATVAGPPSEKLVAAAEAFLRRPIQNRIGKAWIASQNAAVMRTNPTGFSIKQSMLDWQIIDANGKAVQGKRFPFKKDAEAELARLNAGVSTLPPAPPPRQAAPPPVPRQVSAPAPSPAPMSSGGEYAVVDEKRKFVSASMSRAEAEKMAKELLGEISPDWDPYDRGVELMEETDWGDTAERHAFDIAQEMAEEEWEQEAEQMRRERNIRVVSASEARAIKQAMLAPKSSYSSSPSYGEPWPGYSGHGRGGFGGAGGWGPGGGRGGWGGY